MQPCLHPATLPTGLDVASAFRAASGAGFRLIEYSARRLIDFAAEGGELQHVLGETSVVPVHCGWSAGLRSSRAEFDAALPRAAEEMGFAARFGCVGGSLVLPFRRERGAPDPDEADTLDRIGQVAELAAANGLTIVLEFVGLHIPAAPAHTYRDLASTLRLLAQARRPNLGVLLDSYHWHLSRGTMDDFAAIPAGTPLFVHINDAPPGDVSTLDDSMRLLPGEGVIDLPAFLGAIAARGYDGAVSVELFSERLRTMTPEEAAQRAYNTTAAAITRAGVRRAG